MASVQENIPEIGGKRISYAAWKRRLCVETRLRLVWKKNHGIRDIAITVSAYFTKGMVLHAIKNNYEFWVAFGRADSVAATEEGFLLFDKNSDGSLIPAAAYYWEK